MENQLTKFAKIGWPELLAVFFPDQCAGCQQPMSHGESVICTSCLSALPYTDYHRFADNPVEKLFWGRAPIEAGAALFYFNKGNRVQRLMHQLKYHKDKEVGLTIGRMMGARIKNAERFAGIERVVPVPLHPKKQKVRGFNQSELIARGISEETGWALDTESLIRTINNPTQTKKSRLERHQNVKGVFTLNNFDRHRCQHVLIVDDVVTTGSTLESCIVAFQKTGYCDVSICVAACAE